MCQWPPSALFVFLPTSFGYIFQPRIFTKTVTVPFLFTLKLVIEIARIMSVRVDVAALPDATSPSAATSVMRARASVLRKLRASWFSTAHRTPPAQPVVEGRSYSGLTGWLAVHYRARRP